VADAIKLNRITTSPYKDFVKFFYDLGGLGYHAKVTMDRIVSEMGSARYYRVGLQPVLTVTDPTTSKFHVDRFILASGATFIDTGTEQYYTQNPGYSGPILFEAASGFVQSAGNTPILTMVEYMKTRYAAMHAGVQIYLILAGGYFYYDGPELKNATSGYTILPTTFSSDHTYQSLVNHNMGELMTLLGASKTVVPVLVTGCENFNINGRGPGYIVGGTPSEITAYLGQLKALINSGANINFIPFVKTYNIGETVEGGLSAPIPKKLPNGTIDTSIMDAIQTGLTN
jgi:hypothetical protein